MRGGKRIGAGRPSGARNKKTLALQEAVDQQSDKKSEGEDSLVFLERVMKDEGQPIQVRLEAAKAVAPYRHPRLSSMEITPPSVDATTEEMEAKLIRLFEKGKDNPLIQAMFEKYTAQRSALFVEIPKVNGKAETAASSGTPQQPTLEHSSHEYS